MGREIFPISDTLRESYPKLQNEVIRQQDEDARLSRRIEEHKKSKDHPAENITYDGKVKKDNVRDAIDEMDARVNNIVSQGGDDNTEVVDARHSTLKGKTFNVLKERLDDIEGDLLDPKEIEFSDYGSVISLPDAAIGGQLHGSFKGDTIVNHAGPSGKGYNSSEDDILVNNGNIHNGILEMVADGKNYKNFRMKMNFKPNTQYTAIVDVLEMTLKYDFILIRHNEIDTSNVFIPVGFTGKCVRRFTTGDTVGTSFLSYIANADPEGGRVKLKNLMILEGDYTNRPINYTEGNKSIPASFKIKSVGNNLLDFHNVQRFYNSSLSNIDNNSIEIVSANGKRGYVSYLVKVKPHTTYNISMESERTGVEGGGLQIYGYDEYNNTNVFISGNANETKNMNFSSGAYRYIEVRLFVSFANGQTGDRAVFSNIQLEKGDTPTEYEPYKESTSYIVAKDKDNKILNLNRLPNGVYDEIDLNACEVVKRTKDHILQDGDITFMSREKENIDYATIVLPDYAVGTKIATAVIIPDIPFGNESIHNMDDEKYIGTWGGQSSKQGQISYAMAKGTTLEQAREQLKGVKVIYQLSYPKTLPIQWQGINTYKGGQIEISNTFPEIGFYYKQGLKSHYPNYPINQVTELYKVDKETGLRTSVDISKCVISDDKLSFTHPDLKNGDLCDWDYITEDNFPYTQCNFATGTNMSASVASLLKNDDLKKELIRQLWSGLDGHRRDLKMHVTPELKEDIENQGTVLNIHVQDSNNPHAVDKGQIGLGNVDNTKQASKKEFDEHISGPFHIVESGSNENGNYVKYADGTLECWAAIPVQYQAVNYLSLKGDKEWTYPHRFIDKPVLLVSKSAHWSYDRMIRANAAGTPTDGNSAQIRLYSDPNNKFQSGDTYTLFALAKGKWK